MKFLLKKLNDILPTIQDYHVLTYAEEGFSPLDIHTRKYDYPSEVLKELVINSNLSDQVQTMLPHCNLSIIPRRFIRGPVSTIELHKKLLEFFDLNASEIKANKFIFDFRTNELQRYILDAIYMLSHDVELRSVEEIIIIDTSH